MGEIAEDMREGCCCSLCGQYFDDPVQDAIYCHGEPVVCKKCWESLSEQEKKPHKKATADTI